MELSTLSKKLKEKLLSGDNIISEFNTVKRYPELKEKLIEMFPSIESPNIGQLLSFGSRYRYSNMYMWEG